MAGGVEGYIHCIRGTLTRACGFEGCSYCIRGTLIGPKSGAGLEGQERVGKVGELLHYKALTANEPIFAQYIT